MKLKVDSDRCLRCGMCAASFPEVFDFNDEGDIEVKNLEIGKWRYLKKSEIDGLLKNTNTKEI